MPKAVELILVMPVYNEETTIRHTIIGWGDILRDHVGQGAYQICVVNDGSTDNTLKEINLVNQERSDIVLISQQNQGHGSALRSGYEYVLSNGAEWVLQVDSDGQCDPNDFPKFWIGRSKGRVRMGFRWIRKDGLIRWLVSRIVTFQIFAVSGYWLLDANVPYRLMPQELLRIALNMAPLERLFFLNILLAVNFKLLSVIDWIPIRFLKRNDGKSSLNYKSFLRYRIVLKEELERLFRPYSQEGCMTRWVRRYHFSFLLKFLDQSQSILEIGSGSKMFTWMLQSRGHRVTTVDIEESADYMINIKNWRQTNLKEHSYDVIVAREVIEHVDCIQDIQDLCRPKGLIFISTPHPSFDWLLKRLEGLGINQKRGTAHDCLVNLRDIPIQAIKIKRPLWIAQMGVFINQKNI